MAWPATSTTTANLNLRVSPTTSSQVLTVMPKAGSIQITGPAQNGWLPVTYNGQTGWASASYINPPTPSTTTPTTPAPDTSPAPPAPPQSVPAGQPQNPFYDPGATDPQGQNWYQTPIVSQSQDFDSEWEKMVTDQGFGGFGTKANIARGLIDRAKSGFGAATMNDPNLTARGYIDNKLGPNFLRSAMAQMTPIQRGEMRGIYSPRARWNER